MIEFFAGLALGLGMGLILARYLGHTDASADVGKGTSVDTDGLNNKKTDPEQELKERQEKQFRNLMAYTGKKQA